MIYKYNKLVRDKIVENIEQKGKKCTYKIMEDEEYKKELDKKLLEEANEFIADHSVEEMADLTEVITSIMRNRNITKDEVNTKMKEKRDKKGGFEKRIFLYEVEEDEINEKEEENKVEKQKALWNNLRDTDSLKDVQKYIKGVNTIRGFEGQEVQNTMLLLTEEIGELAKAIRKNVTSMCTDINKQYNYDTIESEVSDCFYVLTSICNNLDIDMFTCLKDKEKENINRIWKK